MKHAFCSLPVALTAAMLSAASPAAADQARAILSVGATVAPSCQVDHGSEPGPTLQVACSTGAGFSTRTSALHDDRPLDRASDILGAPARRGRRVTFSGALLPPHDARRASAAPTTQYLTVSY